MNNLFSIFDASSQILGLTATNWFISCLTLMFIPPMFWCPPSQMATTTRLLVKALLFEVSAVLGDSWSHGAYLFFSSYFMFIILTNTFGLLPYVFTGSSHLVFTMSLALPLWIGSMVWAGLFQSHMMLAHLVPTGTPPALMPVMVIIETVSNFIRPGALAIRLAANMVAGHLLLSLLGGAGPMASPLMSLVVVTAISMLMLLESAVAGIQAYVFTILSTLYLSELTAQSFPLKIGSVK